MSYLFISQINVCHAFTVMLSVWRVSSQEWMFKKCHAKKLCGAFMVIFNPGKTVIYCLDFFQCWYVSKMVQEPGKVWLQVSSAEPRMSKISIWECIKWENCCRVSLGYWWKICTAAQAVGRQENFLIWFKENLSPRISHPIPTRYWRAKAWQKIMVCRWILSHFNFQLIFFKSFRLSKHCYYNMKQ